MSPPVDPRNRPHPAASGRLLLLAAALLWSTSGFFAKSPIFLDWPIETADSLAIRGPLLAFWRTLIAGLVLLPLVRRPRWSLRLVPAVLVFTAMNVTYLTAMSHTTAANAIWLQSTAPVWVFLIGVVWLGEPVHPRDWILLSFGFLGVGLILFFEIRGQSWAGVLYGLAAGMTYGGVVLTLRWLRDQDAAWVVVINHLATAAILLPYVLFLGIWPTGHQTLYLTGFGVLQMGVPYWLFARGVQSVPSHEASGIVLLEPVLVPVWVFLAWRHEPSYDAPAWWTLVGGSLILAGLFLRYVRQRSRP